MILHHEGHQVHKVLLNVDVNSFFQTFKNNVLAENIKLRCALNLSDLRG